MSVASRPWVEERDSNGRMAGRADSHHETYRTGDERPISRTVIERAIDAAERQERWKIFGRRACIGLGVLVAGAVLIAAMVIIAVDLALTLAHELTRLETMYGR